MNDGEEVEFWGETWGLGCEGSVFQLKHIWRPQPPKSKV